MSVFQRVDRKEFDKVSDTHKTLCITDKNSFSLGTLLFKPLYDTVPMYSKKWFPNKLRRGHYQATLGAPRTSHAPP